MSSIQRNNNLFWQLKNYLTYSGEKNEHRYTLMIGQDLWESSWEYEGVTASSLPSNDIHNPSLGSNPQISSGFGSSSMASFFGRATYNYGDRYMGTYTYRKDGSSNFGPKNRWAGFHVFAFFQDLWINYSIGTTLMLSIQIYGVQSVPAIPP
jgi:hypothetical protein